MLTPASSSTMCGGGAECIVGSAGTNFLPPPAPMQASLPPPPPAQPMISPAVNYALCQPACQQRCTQSCVQQQQQLSSSMMPAYAGMGAAPRIVPTYPMAAAASTLQQHLVPPSIGGAQQQYRVCAIISRVDTRAATYNGDPFFGLGVKRKIVIKYSDDKCRHGKYVL